MARRSAFLILLCAGALLTGAGTAAAAPSWLPPQTLTATDSKAPVVAVAPDGTTVAAWSRASGTTSVVEAARRRPGQGFGTPVLLGADASDPQVGIDAAGNATVAWEQEDAGVRAARLPAATGFEGAATVVPGGTGPRLAVGAGGTAVALASVGGVLQAAIRPGAGGAFGTAAPISAGAVDDPDVAVAPDGRAVAAWVEGGSVLRNARPANAAFATTGTAQSDGSALAEAEPSVAIATDGDAVIAWTEDADDVAGGETAVVASVAFGPPAPASSAGAAARAPDLATAPDGRVAGTWVRGGAVEVAELAAGGSAFGNHAAAPSAPAANARPAVGIGADGATVVAWAGGTAVHAARRPAAGGVLTTAVLAAGAGAGDPSAGADGQGNATAAWLSPGRRVTVATFDAAAPVLSAVSVPASGRAGGPALAMSAAASDRIGPVTLRWAFGDGTTATGGAVAHAFGAAGAFDVTVTATDAAGNAAAAVRRVAVAPAATPPPRPPQVARVAARVQLRWRVRGKRIKLERMRLTGMPAAAEAELRCKGKRCPIRRTRIFTPSPRGAIDVVKPLDIDQRRFRAGQRLDLRISAPGHVGQVLRFNLNRGRQPKALARCMPIGSSSIRRSC